MRNKISVSFPAIGKKNRPELGRFDTISSLRNHVTHTLTSLGWSFGSARCMNHQNSANRQRGYTRTNGVTTWRVAASSRTVRGVGGGWEARLTKDLSRDRHGRIASPRRTIDPRGPRSRRASRRPRSIAGPSCTAYFKR